MIDPEKNINIFKSIINLFKPEKSNIDKSIDHIADQIFKYTVVDYGGKIEKGRVSHINDPVVSMEEIRSYVRETGHPDVYLNDEQEVVTLQDLVEAYSPEELREQLNKDLPRQNCTLNINDTAYTFFYFGQSDAIKKVKSYEDLFLLLPVIENHQAPEEVINLLDIIDPERIQEDLGTRLASLLIQTVAEYEIKKVLFSGKGRSSEVLEDHFNISLDGKNVIMDRTMTIKECDLEEPLDQEQMNFYALNLEVNLSHTHSVVLERKIELPTEIVDLQ